MLACYCCAHVMNKIVLVNLWTGHGEGGGGIGGWKGYLEKQLVNRGDKDLR